MFQSRHTGRPLWYHSSITWDRARYAKGLSGGISTRGMWWLAATLCLLTITLLVADYLGLLAVGQRNVPSAYGVTNMISGILSLALSILIILAVVWIILWVIKMFIAIPAQIEKVIWIIALLLCLIKLAYWAGI